jgi:hypothetical protein
VEVGPVDLLPNDVRIYISRAHIMASQLTHQESRTEEVAVVEKSQEPHVAAWDLR